MKNFFIKLAMINSNSSSNRNITSKAIRMTPERRNRRNRLETGIRSESVSRRRNPFPRLSPADSPRRLPFGPLRILKSNDQPQQIERGVNYITSLREKERIKLLKKKVENYRRFIESFELPSKISSRLLQNSSKNKIKNPKNFQYSLGIPKKVVYDTTSVNINGLRGELTKMKEHKSKAVFRSNEDLKKFILEIPNKPFYICQSTCAGHDCNGKKMAELGLYATSEIKESMASIINYSTRKILIRSRFKFEDDYRSKKNGLYANINFNIPLLHVFNSEEISILNYHRSVKFGGKRIINKVDLIKRKLIPSKEIKHNFDPKEKIEDIMRVTGTKFYFFLKFSLEKTVTLFFYDFEEDKRIKLGEIETTTRIRDGNKNTYSVINPQNLGEVDKEKIRRLIIMFKEEFNSFPSHFDMEDILVIIDINILLSYKESQNFFCFVSKSGLCAYCLDVSPIVLFDAKFDQLISYSGVVKE